MSLYLAYRTKGPSFRKEFRKYFPGRVVYAVFVKLIALINDQMINDKKIDLLSHMENLLVAHAECLLWSRQGSNPVPFGL
jgi:hypothetical protein